MRKRNTTAPLKAYEVYEVGIDWRGARKEYSYGLAVGRTPGQARAQVATDRISDGVKNPWASLRSRRAHGREAELAIEKFEDRRKYWRHTRAYARQQAEAEEFNRQWPVGTPVQVVDCCEASHWPDGITITRTPAWAPSESCVLVSLEGYAGGFYLDKVVPLVEPVTLS